MAQVNAGTSSSGDRSGQEEEGQPDTEQPLPGAKELTVGDSVIVEEQPRIVSEQTVPSAGGHIDEIGGSILETGGEQSEGGSMDLGGQQSAVISLVLQPDSGHIPCSQAPGTAALPGSSLAATEVGKGVLDDGDTLESVQFVEGPPSSLLQCKDVEDNGLANGQAFHLDDGTAAFIHQVSADKFSSIEDGQTVQLGDGSTAYILRASLKGEGSNLQAVQLEDGTTALLQTANFDSNQDDSESGDSLSVLNPFSESTDAVGPQQTTIHVSGTSTLTPASGSSIQLKTNEAGALTIKAVAPSGDVFGKDFRCTYSGCGRYYTSAHHLKVHVRSHTGERPFPCTHCEKAFATSYGLKSHTRVHTGEKPYRCPFANCAKAFKTSGDLQKHIRIHTGERPFKCPFEGCDKRFTTSNIRKVHIRTHTGERPYLCQEQNCGRAFSSATNFKNHLRIHSGEKPYVCTVSGCGKRFTEYSSLYKHHVVHTYSKPYSCLVCGKNYRQASTLSLHRRTAHGLLDDEMPPTQVPESSPGTDQQPGVSLQISRQPAANTFLVTTRAPPARTTARGPSVADAASYVTVISDPAVQATPTLAPEVILSRNVITTTADSTSPVPAPSGILATSVVTSNIEGAHSQGLPSALVENPLTAVATSGSG